MGQATGEEMNDMSYCNDCGCPGYLTYCEQCKPSRVHGISTPMQQLISRYTVAVRKAHTSSLLKENLECQRALYEAEGIALGKLQIAIAEGVAK